MFYFSKYFCLEIPPKEKHIPNTLSPSLMAPESLSASGCISLFLVLCTSYCSFSRSHTCF